jgi:hypothetical protein
MRDKAIDIEYLPTWRTTKCDGEDARRLKPDREAAEVFSPVGPVDVVEDVGAQDEVSP